MALRINSNITALYAHSNLVKNDRRLSGSIERLSSGLRINKAADDAAGLTISEKLRTQVRGLKRAQMNVQDGSSLIQTAEGALNEVTSMLHRMRELALQSANDTLTTTDRLEIQKEIAQLKEDVDRISYDTEFNTKKLLDGSGTAVVSTSDPDNIDGIVTGEVVTFSDFSVEVLVKSEYVAGEGHKTYYGRPEVQRSAIFLKEDGSIADSNTMLMSIPNFIDDNGNFILEHPQMLYIQGDNSQGTLEVNKGLTLGQLTERIQGAMTTDQLGKGLEFEGSEARYDEGGEHAGQIMVTSGRNGKLGRINFTGSEDLVKALGFGVVTEPEDPIYSVAVTNIGVPVGERVTLTSQVSGHKVGNLIKGMDISFEPPQVANVKSKPAELGITIAKKIEFKLSDSHQPIVSDSISIPAGIYSMNQIAEVINKQIDPDNDTFAEVGPNGGISFGSKNMGSSAWAKISELKVGGADGVPNELGMVAGTYYGSGGVGASTTAVADLAGADYDFSDPSSFTFSIIDSHGNDTKIVLNKNYNAAGNGLEELIEDINAQMGTVPVTAEVKEGRLSFKSKETGFDSGFRITQPTKLLNRLKIAEPNPAGVTGGTPVSQEFAYDEAHASYGFVVAGKSPDNDLKFNFADLDGKSHGVAFTSNENPGQNFVTVTSIANEINDGSNKNGVKISASVDPITHEMAIVSTIPGKTGKVTIADASANASANNVAMTLGITPATYENGVGNYSFRMHVKNTKIQLQVGPNEGDTAMCHIGRVDCKALGIEDLDLTTAVSATRAITLVDNALNYVTSERARLGAVENRLTYTSNSLAVAEKNMTASESRIRDCDMAAEVIEMTQAQILHQASNAMVAQANTSAQSVLELLR